MSKNNNLVQPLELAFLSKILEDNTRYLNTKIASTYLKDPLARTIYSIAGITITKLGQFQPYIHLSELCKDEARMEKYRELNYPLDFTEPSEIVTYIEQHKNDTVKFETIEEELRKRWIREQMVEIANEILDNIDNSKIHPSELMVKVSGALDSMIYQNHETVIAKTATEVSDDFLAYLASDDVVTYVPVGIDSIDSVTGGTPSSAVISWVSPARRYSLVA